MERTFGLGAKKDLLRDYTFRQHLAKVYRDLRIGGGTGPVNIGAAAQVLGIRTITDPSLPCEGRIGTARDGQRIMVVRDPHSPRGRFTVAHEVAHEVVRTYPEFEKAVSESGTEEGFCDFVAGLLLMPLPEFVPQVWLLGCKGGGITWNDYDGLAKRWGVSTTSCFLQIALLSCVHFGVLVSEFDSGRNGRVLQNTYSAGWQGWFVLHGRAPQNGVAQGTGESIRASCMLVIGNCERRLSVSATRALNDSGTHWDDPDASVVVERRHAGGTLVACHFLRPAAPRMPSQLRRSIDADL
jgi:hypothetical protein